MGKIVGFRPNEASKPGSLYGYSGASNNPPVPAGITHATETIMASFQCPRQGYPVLEKLYMDGDASASGYLHFRVTSNGQTLAEWWSDTYNAVSENGMPVDIGYALPQGALIEVRCKNEHASDDSLKGYCAGEIRIYDQPI